MLTLLFQIVIPLIPVSHTETLAVDETTEEQQSTDEQVEATEEISRNYEIKEEETWDISKNGDGSIIAKWTLNNKTLTISGTGEMKNWTSYSEEDWHDTQYTEVIEKVIIENGITRIGEEAFAGCTSLKSIEIPESLVSIATEAFMDCESLSEIDLSKNVSIIGSWAFRGCFSLQYVELSSKIEEIFSRGLIQAEAMNFIRGRSIVRTYLIIDEAQNMTPGQVKGIITRAGKGTKIILLGDPAQIDRPFLDERTNGLCYASEHMKGSPLCWQITMKAEECERSELATDAIRRL